MRGRKYHAVGWEFRVFRMPSGFFAASCVVVDIFQIFFLAVILTPDKKNAINTYQLRNAFVPGETPEGQKQLRYGTYGQKLP